MTRQPAPCIDDYAHLQDMETRWDDNDIYGHLNNTVHYRLFDTAVNRFLLSRGVLDFRQSQNVFLVVETGCRYFAELAYPDQLCVGLRLEKLGSSSVRYGTALFKKGERMAAAAGHFVHVNIDRQTRRPTPITPAFRQVFESLAASSLKADA